MADKKATSQEAKHLSPEEAQLAIKAIEEVERQEANEQQRGGGESKAA